MLARTGGIDGPLNGNGYYWTLNHAVPLCLELRDNDGCSSNWGNLQRLKNGLSPSPGSLPGSRKETRSMGNFWDQPARKHIGPNAYAKICTWLGARNNAKGLLCKKERGGGAPRKRNKLFNVRTINTLAGVAWKPI